MGSSPHNQYNGLVKVPFSPFGLSGVRVAHDGHFVDSTARGEVRLKLAGSGFVIHLAHIAACGDM